MAKEKTGWEKRFWEIWNNWNDTGGHDTDPEELLALFSKELKRAKQEMGKALKKEDISFLFLEKMKETNGVMLRSVIEAYYQAISDYLKESSK